MLAWNIADVKEFMSKLLIKDTFDTFYLSELEIVTFYKVHLSGRLNQDWYSGEEREALGAREYSWWKEVKPLVFQMVKGSRTPQFMKIVFALDEERTNGLLEELGGRFKRDVVEGLYLNLRYENHQLHLTSGTSLRIFTLDKELELQWDGYVKTYLREKGIAALEEGQHY